MTNNIQDYSKCQLTWLVLLRVAIGWHFLYEGFLKLTDSTWSAQAYLLDSKGPLAGLFTAMANNEGVLKVVDFCNEWGLFLIGLGLVLGIFGKLAAWGGIAILALYYVSHPSFIGIEFAFPMEGNYLIVDKNLVELIALGVLTSFPTSRVVGLDRFLDFGKKQ